MAETNTTSSNSNRGPAGKRNDPNAPVFVSDEAMSEREALKDLARQEYLFEKEIENIQETGDPLKDLEKKKYKVLSKRKEQEEEKYRPAPNWMRKVLIFSGALVSIIGFFFGVGYFRLMQMRSHEDLAYQSLTQSQRQAVDSEDDPGFVKGEETTQTQNTDPAMASSEHFKLQEVNVGGGLALVTVGENAQIQISDIRSEPFTAKQGDEVKILISWKTNKLSASSLEYSPNGSTSVRKLSEDNYSFSHSVLLSKLLPKTSYVYTISAKDRWGNVIKSDRYGVYTASKPESVIDLIVRALEETFGWAMKK